MKLHAACQLAGLIFAAEFLLIPYSPNLAFSQSRQFGRTAAALKVGQGDLGRARSLYGPGAQTTVDNVQSLCYYVEQDDAYLSMSAYERRTQIRSISLTKSLMSHPDVGAPKSRASTSRQPPASPTSIDRVMPT